MAEQPRVAGIILAGGKSSRMGRDKALLEFNGRPLVVHMMAMLHELGLAQVYISGSLPGYPCIPDAQPFMGPAQGICNVMRHKPGYDGYLCVPVDMPLLNAALLRMLLVQGKGACFAGWPLPLYLVPPLKDGIYPSVRDVILAHDIQAVALPRGQETRMTNANTPQQWKEITGKL